MKHLESFLSIVMVVTRYIIRKMTRRRYPYSCPYQNPANKKPENPTEETTER